MKSFFSVITRGALRFRAITLSIVALVIIGGIGAGLELKQELIPPVEFPQTFIIAQASGMTSEEVLTVVTSRLEQELLEIPEIVNVDSQSSGTFGAFVIASNDFGLNQQKLQRDILAAIDKVWFPSRRIAPAENQDASLFAANLMETLNADLLIYIAERNPNFLFQLEPDTWASFSEETINTLLGYLANNVAKDDAAASALTRLIEQEVVPQLNTVDIVARVEISGGQVLPDADGNFVAEASLSEGEAQSLLLQLSPDVWAAIAEKVDIPDTQDNAAVEALAVLEYSIPEDVPLLPENWQMDHFENVTDILEMSTGVRTVSAVFNDFVDTGIIKGAPGTTEDLTPEMVERMLEIEPSLVQYFDAEQLAAMPDDVFAVLPDDYIDGLDGFTRDALAAKALAASITGEDAAPEPVELPSQWRIAPPQLLTFSFADLPLATFSVFTTTEFATDVPVSNETASDETGDNTDAEDEETDADSEALDLPEGNDLPQLYSLIGELFGAELNMADDLVQIQLSDDFADLLGSNQLTSSEFLNLTTQFSNFAAPPAEGDEAAAPEGFEDFDVAAFIPALTECGVGLLSIDFDNLDFGAIIIGCLDAETAQYLIDNDPTFPDELQAGVIANLSDEVLALDGISPLLDNTWATLAGQPQFAELTLNSADDVLALGNGNASTVLNNINATVPERFAGYEIRLFDSLTPTTLRYFATNEADFYTNLDSDVLVKFSQEALAALPEDVTASLDDNTLETITAITTGAQESAATALTNLYTSDIPPGDPDAPAIGDGWSFVGDFFGLELDSADDFFRFPADFVFDSPAAFINGLFQGPGSGFAADLMQSLTVEQLEYMLGRDATVLDDLDIIALTNMTEEALAALPESLQRRAEEGGERFTPTNQVTRTDGAFSLLVTVYKDTDANTVEAFYAVSDVIDTINAENDNIEVQVAFEQSSFIEESIAGVIREGSLGAVFAIINILIFLSGDTWGQNGRRITGTIIIVVSVVFMAGLILLQMSQAGVGIGEAFAQADTVLRILAILGIISGFLILFAPGSLPYPAWRSTIVIGVSIPLSILSALALMQWLPPVINGAFGPLAESEDALSGLFTFILRLAPDNLTLNIMTLSGLTVAVGRVVDDSIVVLENIFRQMQSGMDKREAILSGTRDVSAAIFSATGIAVVVFLPLGLTGGLIGEFFLPFGLAVTYSLLSSFLVAVTVVPVVSYIFVNVEDVPEEKETWMQRLYVPLLSSILKSSALRWGVIIMAVLSLGISGVLFGTRPAAFLPDFGEPQISISISLPQGTTVLETNELVEDMEAALPELVDAEELSTVRTIVGGGSLSFESLVGGGGGVSENLADITVSIRSGEVLEASIPDIRTKAEEIFGEDNVTVSGGTIASGGFGGFELITTGPDQDVLAELDTEIIEILNGVEGITNVSSNLSAAALSDEGPVTYIRVNAQPALSYTGELETENTIGIAAEALEAINEAIEFPEGFEIGQGFDTELQAEGFVDMFRAIGIALVIIVIILFLVFQSPVYWLALILSVLVAPVGAAIALTITDRVLGISAMIGLLMLLGLVVTNAIVLIDRVASNRYERGMNLYDALVEAGARRVRPILMTAIATIIALMPLAIGLSEGAIIASELGTVVIGGVVSSTLLTLIVVPAAYYLLTPIHDALTGIFRRNNNDESAKQK